MMAKDQLQSILLRQPFDIRVAIYSELDLPPFAECRKYAGFFLSCQQVKDEIEYEANLQFKRYLSDREKHDDNKDAGLTLIPPASALKSPVVTVEIPFQYPMDDWHNLVWADRRSNGLMFFDEGKKTQQRIAPTIQPLFSLFLSRIKFVLLPTEDAIHHINAEESRITIESRELQDTPLGVLIGQYKSCALSSIIHHALDKHCQLGSRHPLNAKKMTLQWDFRSTYEENDEWMNRIERSKYYTAGARYKGKFTSDRRAGRFQWTMEKKWHAEWLDYYGGDNMLPNFTPYYEDWSDGSDWSDVSDWSDDSDQSDDSDRSDDSD